MKPSHALAAVLLAAAPCRADWRDVPDVKGVCSAGCEDRSATAGRQREYVPPEPTPGSIAYRHGSAGAALGRAGDWAGAEREYRTALELDPASRNGSIYAYQLGYALLMQDRLAEAEAALRRSLTLRDYDYAHDNLAWVLEKLGRHEEAEREYLAVVRMSPDKPGAAESLATLVDRRWNAVRGPAAERALALDGAAAEAAWRRYLAAVPQSRAAHNNLGLSLREQGRLLEAEAAFREAARRDPDDGRVRAELEDLRAMPTYSAMLSLARGAEHWSRLAAGSDSDVTRWLSMRCLDDGCSYAADPVRDAALLDAPPGRPAPPGLPPAVRRDPRVRELEAEKETLSGEYRETADALKAVLKAKEDAPTSPSALDLLELEHKEALSAKRGAVRAKDAALEERYKDLGFVIPQAP